MNVKYAVSHASSAAEAGRMGTINPGADSTTPNSAPAAVVAVAASPPSNDILVDTRSTGLVKILHVCVTR